MNSGDTLTTRNVTICFRTTDALQDALRAIGKNEKRSVSSVIENILTEYVHDRKQWRRPRKEKRRHARKKVGVPALVTHINASDKQVHSAIVLDISLGGLQISVPTTFSPEIHEDTQHSKISVVFTLPDGKKPLTVQCVPNRLLPHDDATIIGASFTDADFGSYQALQDYLVN